MHKSSQILLPMQRAICKSYFCAGPKPAITPLRPTHETPSSRAAFFMRRWLEDDHANLPPPPWAFDFPQISHPLPGVNTNMRNWHDDCI
jgi:hypothetical protein